jgi:mono/diheme cytochrome c family protein
MWKHVTILSMLALLALPALSRQKKQSPPAKASSSSMQVASAQHARLAAASADAIPAEASSLPNPVRPNAESIADGKRVYGFDCAMCHGDLGDGKGDLAPDLKVKLPDFRDPEALKNRSDGDLFYIISKGRPGMNGEEGRQSVRNIWDMVNYIRSFSKPQTAAKPRHPRR